MGFLTGAGLLAKVFGGWILRNPWVIAVTMLSAAFVLVVVSKNSAIHTIKDESSSKDTRIEQLIASLAQSRANVANLSTTLATQSASIDALKVQGDASLTKFDTIIAGQAAANASTTKKLAALDVAKPGTDKCASAFELVRSTVQ